MDTSWEGRGQQAKIKVIGIGGGGSNAVNRMIEAGLTGVEFIAVNTDAQALALSNAPIRVRIGDDLTKGLGSGGNPDVGAKAAEESKEALRSVLADADMVFVTTGLGGGTGTGASPVVAQIAQSLGALTVAVVTRPFAFEGARRAAVANEGMKKLGQYVDTLVSVQNDRLLQLTDRHVPLQQAFTLADDVLRQGIQGISEVITVPGLINVDFADVKAIMTNGGAALMAIGRATGEDRAMNAAQQAITSPLLDIDISGATGVLFTVKGGDDLALLEVSRAADLIRQTAAPDANIIFGAVVDGTMRDQVQITVIATGFSLDQRGRVRVAESGRLAPEPRAAEIAARQAAVRDSTPAAREAESPRPAPDGARKPPRPPEATDLDIPAFLRRK